MSATTLSQREVKVRKFHPCEWCTERIQVGERALYYVGIFEGCFHTWYMHPECFEASQEDGYFTDWEFIPNEHKRGSVEEMRE